jgi:hypothetical protein
MSCEVPTQAQSPPTELALFIGQVQVTPSQIKINLFVMNQTGDQPH